MKRLSAVGLLLVALVLSAACAASRGSSKNRGPSDTGLVWVQRHAVS